MNRYFIRLFIPIVLFLSTLAYLAYRNHQQNTLDDLLDDQQNNLSLKQDYLRDYLSGMISDVYFLSNSDIPERVLADSSRESLRDLALFSRTAQRYDQLRILDSQGVEILRINYREKQPFIVPQGELQDKRHRFYFQESRNLGANQIYVSPIDLNVEHHQIEVPYKPVIRMISRLDSGSNAAFFVVNAAVQECLETIRSMKNNDAETILLNNDGYWLIGPEKYRKFGFMFVDHSQETFRTAYPDVWINIMQKGKGYVRDETGLFVFSNLDFSTLFDELTYVSDNLLVYPQANDLINISHIEQEALAQILNADQFYFYGAILVIILFSAALAYVRSQAFIKEIRAKGELEGKNAELSQLVNELSTKNTQLKEFSQIVSHNLRGPISNLGILLDYHENSDGEKEKKKWMKSLSATAQSLNTLMQDLVKSVKIINADRLKLQACSVSKTVEKVKMLLHAEIENTEAQIKVDTATWNTIQYPELYFESILLNLVSNAIKYTKADESPTISVKTFISNGKKALSVKDSGLGIDLERHGSAIFKMNKRFHLDVPGKGIGLFMTKTQIESMGGKIQVKSEPNKGTEFIVLFDTSG